MRPPLPAALAVLTGLVLAVSACGAGDRGAAVQAPPPPAPAEPRYVHLSSGHRNPITFGALYYLTPRLWGRERLYSTAAVSWHFWLATIGIVLYASSMWVAGITQGLMWREYTPQGFLANSFVETVAAKHVENIIRTLGGAMYLTGAVIMSYNLWRTVRMPGLARRETAATGAALAPAE